MLCPLLTCCNMATPAAAFAPPPIELHEQTCPTTVRSYRFPWPSRPNKWIRAHEMWRQEFLLCCSRQLRTDGLLFPEEFIPLRMQIPVITATLHQIKKDLLRVLIYLIRVDVLALFSVCVSGKHQLANSARFETDLVGHVIAAC